MKRNHTASFENEALCHKLLGYFNQKATPIKFITILEIFKILHPNNRKLFQDRKCVRKIKYIGGKHAFFKKGEIYESKSYNGATYTVNDYPRRIGDAYFVRED